jgi:release factor glutamine methyltransferase
MRADAAQRQASLRLAEAGIEQPRREARLLATFLLGLPPAALPDPAAELDEAALQALVARRAAHEPMAFITGRRGFWTLDLEVSPDTLIPRPDSETLIEAALAAFPDRAAPLRVLDLGTGTGCLLLAALTEFGKAWGVGVDRSPRAAALAARNAAKAGLSGRTCFFTGNWGDAMDTRFDLVLCNPPYIPGKDIAGLAPEVALHEPRSALDGGQDGLESYRRVLADLPRLLAGQGVALLELGQGQDRAVGELARVAGFSGPSGLPDLAGIIRVMRLGGGTGKGGGDQAIPRLPGNSGV